MDLRRTIRELQDEKRRLDVAIQSLEDLLGAELNGPAEARGRRGRTSMGFEERREVSERMARYWANRRAATGTPGMGQSAEAEQPSTS